MKKETKISLVALVLFFVVASLVVETIATSSNSSNNANLTIWDDTDSEGGNLSKYTYGLTYPTKTSILWNVYFYTNYTNSTGNPINNSFRNCTVRFDETGTWTNWFNMSYNYSSLLWQYNRTFMYKGILPFQVNCTNQSDSLSAIDNVTISNTIPKIKNKDEVSGEMPAISCSEDSLCYYNFSVNVSEHDINDILVYSYDEQNTTLTNFTLNSSAGILEINVTRNEDTGNKDIFFEVKDSNNAKDYAKMPITITAVNDAPVFVGLQNKTFNMSELFEYIVNVTDEENDIPFTLNITFMNCSVAEWSTRNCSNSSGKELFNSSQYNFNNSVLNISFTPSRNDVGSYIINFSVTDNSSLGNKTSSMVINFTVLNINSAPYFTYICDNERNATENSEFTCWINATDIDETINLTFFTNYSWFKFNGSNNSITINWNVSSDYNFSTMVNFTPTDLEVGNWSVNMSLLDVGSGIGAPRHNSTVFWFFIDNVEDMVSLNEIANQTIYENKTIYVNATDNDLLVPDKNIKNEVLSFASNTSWVSISNYFAPSGVNYTTAIIRIDYNTARSIGIGNYTVKINVTDTAGNFAERNFTITIENDTPAAWNASMQTVFVIYENNLTYLNFSQNVTDAENDVITFSFTNDSSFSSFSINSSTGVINFTAIDEDVGQHIVTINASDGKLDSLKSFNFTVYNVNDAPYIEKPILSANVINATVDSSSNINCTEDNTTTIWLWFQDEDFKIPLAQRSFYNESLTINLTIQGPNTTLFNFVIDSSFPTVGNNRSKYDTTFTPRKADVGSYNITIKITDKNNASDILVFNLTVKDTAHNPILMNLTNQTSLVNSSFYYRINATDSEDGSSAAGSNFTFTYNFTSGSNIFNATTFNSTTGEINITFNSTHGGKYHISVTVNDSSGAEDSGSFWLYVYDVPSITFPASDYRFYLKENITSNLIFRANHSIQDNLTYRFYIQLANTTNSSAILRYNITYYGNNSNLTWTFTPNFTDETYSAVRNLTLVVLNPTYPQLNASSIWNMTTNHTNAPVVFSGYIGDSQATYGQEITINLANYFSDIDYSDLAYNQTLNFSVISNETPSYITWSVSDFTLTLSSLIAVRELLTINGTDLEGNTSLTSAMSNSFEIEFTTPATTTVPSSGGGASSPVSLKIIIPDPVSAYKKDKIEVPITLSNTGKSNLYYVSLAAVVAKNNIIRQDIGVSFSKDYFPSLLAGKKENVTLTVNIDTEEMGLYEITINASVKSPEYKDWGKLYLTVKEANKTEVLEKLLFTEEFIAENPECAEITEMVKEAQEYYERGKYTESLKKATEAIEACKYAIIQPALPREKESFKNRLYKYLSLSILVLFIIGIAYYFYKRIKFKKAIK